MSVIDAHELKLVRINTAQRTEYFRVLAHYLKPVRVKVLLLAVLILSGIALQLINPQVIRFFIDTTQAGGSDQALFIAAGLFIVFALFQQLIALAVTYIGENVSWSATNRMRADLALHCLRLDMSFFKQHTPGELIARLDGDITELANSFSELAIRVVANLLLIAGILVLLYRVHWSVGLAITVYALITLIALRLVQSRAVQVWKASREGEAAWAGFLEERLAGIEDIRANGGEAYILRKAILIIRQLMIKMRRAHMMSVSTYIMTYLLYVLGYASGIALGVFLYLRGMITIGTVYVILFYIGILETPLQEVRRQVDDLLRATASLSRVNELFHFQSAIKENTSFKLPAGMLAIELKQVSFSYEVVEKAITNEVTAKASPDSKLNGDRTLHNISFQLPAGQVLGVLGRTGSGKTTLTRLLFRLYDSDEGQINIGGVDIRKTALNNLRQQVGMVTQDVQLFEASLRDNLTFFNPNIHDDQILKVIAELGLSSWYQALPAGLDTHLGANGAGFSAGQAQLLAFTRVFLKDPGLVILDEASSRLDLATEQLLEKAVSRLLEGRTGLIVAHRLSTLQRADQILIMEAGRILEYGPRLALANDPGTHFFQLLHTGMQEVLA